MADISFLEQRKLVKRWSGPWPALANLVFTLFIFGVTWWIFQDPRGVMRFYTPYVGYNYCRWWLIILIWMAYTYLNPLASVGPGSYVLWQNLINSWQLWKKRRRDAEIVEE